MKLAFTVNNHPSQIGLVGVNEQKDPLYHVKNYLPLFDERI